MKYVFIAIGVIIVVVAALSNITLTNHSSSSNAGDKLPIPVKETKVIKLTDEQVKKIKDIPSETVIRLDRNKTIVVGGKTYYLIGKDVGTSIITTNGLTNGGQGVLTPLSENVANYKKLYQPAMDCPTGGGQCTNISGNSLAGTIYALKGVVNQSQAKDDPIHTYNIFDVYYDRPELPTGVSEAVLPVYNMSTSHGAENLVSIKLDEANKTLNVTGHFIQIKEDGQEKEYFLQGVNTPTVSGAASFFTYLGELNKLTNTKLTGGTGKPVYVYAVDPYIYMSYLSPDKLKAQTDVDAQTLSDLGSEPTPSDDKQVKLKAFTPVQPTIPFNIYILSDTDTLNPETAYLRPQISDLHVSVGECPVVYLYGSAGMPFTVSLPTDTILTSPITQNTWKGTIQPDGITVNSVRYPYLFYTQSPDQADDIPKTGWVIAASEWPRLEKELLPGIGLTPKESADIVAYLQNTTPYSPFYLISPALTEELGDLVITPTPDTILRYDFTVKGLTSKQTINSPILSPVTRSGFTAVVWKEHILR